MSFILCCRKCSSERVAQVSGKTSDLCWVRVGKVGLRSIADPQPNESDGYVPTDMGICEDGDNNYINFHYCLDCGRIQGKFPLPKTKLEKQAEKAAKKAAKEPGFKQPATVRHVHREGSREHVISYSSAGEHCSTPNCERNFREVYHG